MPTKTQSSPRGIVLFKPLCLLSIQSSTVQLELHVKQHPHKVAKSSHLLLHQAIIVLNIDCMLYVFLHTICNILFDVFILISWC